ncbi:MAG: DUF3098 domain-containing protein [Bacteroidetes bacterium]|nr:DUF3098 domain-containing protein [Bacteroidota bacterium]
MEKNIKKAAPGKPSAPAAKPHTAPPIPVKTGEFAFGKENFRLLFIGLAFIVLGFILMIGGGSNDPKVFNPAIFNFQHITLAPILVLIGYVIEIFAIMKKPKD